MKKNILVVVDVQNDFLMNGSLSVFNEDERDLQMGMIDNINQLLDMEYFDFKIATQDCHPYDHISFACSHDEPLFSEIDVSYGKQKLWPAHCIQDTKGVDFPRQLNDMKFNAIIRKGMNSKIDSYSAFFENDHITKVGLDGLIKGKCDPSDDIELFFCGIATDVCVYYSIIDAVKLGYSCTLIVDACKEVDPKGSNDILNSLMDMGVICIHTNEFLDILDVEEE